jgi:hypothetical protein
MVGCDGVQVGSSRVLCCIKIGVGGRPAVVRVSGSVTQLVVVCSELCIAEGTLFRAT